MVEQQRQRIEQEMTKMINELDHEHLRKLQVNLTKIYQQLVQFFNSVTKIYFHSLHLSQINDFCKAF